MHKLQNLELKWNYDNDAVLSIAESEDKILEAFFIMKDWEFIRNCFKDIGEETETEYQEKRMYFDKSLVYFYVNDEETTLELDESLKAFDVLYELMIDGANYDHHSVRYEPWWHEFIEVYYLLKRKIAVNEAYTNEPI